MLFLHDPFTTSSNISIRFPKVIQCFLGTPCTAIVRGMESNLQTCNIVNELSSDKFTHQMIFHTCDHLMFYISLFFYKELNENTHEERVYD